MLAQSSHGAAKRVSRRGDLRTAAQITRSQQHLERLFGLRWEFRGR